jgi:hypothetical protein
VFVSRFLPAFRALVPVFAGVTRTPLRRIILPLRWHRGCGTARSSIWVRWQGRNLDVLVGSSTMRVGCWS